MRAARRAGWLTALLLSACGGAGSGALPAPVAEDPASAVATALPTLQGPVTGGLRGHALWDSWYDLDALGYVEEEYFVSGTARAHPEGPDAAYTTRMIVRRPKDAARFNGAVLLDWVNVTAQFENSVDTLEAHELFQREGFAYVHLSMQKAGICCLPELTPQAWDPVRYAPLNHPGDEYAFDMLGQIARSFKQPRTPDAMGGLKVQRVIAMGQSQSANLLYAYVNEYQRKAAAIDGFLIHSGFSSTYTQAPQVPVIQLYSDYEADGASPTGLKNYRGWDIAGAAHQNAWVGLHQVLGQGPRAAASAPVRAASADSDLHGLAGQYGEQNDPAQYACIVAGAQFPMRYAVAAAIHHLDRWLRSGEPAPEGPRFQLDAAGALMKDADGNALGGIRYPPMAVPVASYRSDLCGLGGITVPFTELQLTQRYPTHAGYWCRMQAAARESQQQGFLLPEDAADLMARVEGASSRWLQAGVRSCP
ncbi:MAG: alpha/beta hydrolase domain-containing protein [Stagnimonas sp.]|nr:alpha/beta hydrolase domain-containing protein [Stagnimonas sp.]